MELRLREPDRGRWSIRSSGSSGAPTTGSGGWTRSRRGLAAPARPTASWCSVARARATTRSAALAASARRSPDLGGATRSPSPRRTSRSRTLTARVDERDRLGALTMRLFDDLDRVYSETSMPPTDPAVRSPTRRARSPPRTEYDAGGRRSRDVDPLGAGGPRPSTASAGSSAGPPDVGDRGHPVRRRGARRLAEGPARRREPTRPSIRSGARRAARSSSPRRRGRSSRSSPRRYYDAGGFAARRSPATVETDARGSPIARPGRAAPRGADARRRGRRVSTSFDAEESARRRDREGYVTEVDLDGAGRPTAQRELKLERERRWSSRGATTTPRGPRPGPTRSGIVTATTRDALGAFAASSEGRPRCAPGIETTETRTTATATWSGSRTRTATPRRPRYDGANRKRTETRGAGTAVEAATRFDVRPRRQPDGDQGAARDLGVRRPARPTTI